MPETQRTQGSGSLDTETLDIVIEALERRHEQERSIGVITHVQTLAERIRWASRYGQALAAPR